MAQNLSFCDNNAPFFLLENFIWALSLILVIFFLQKNYFFPGNGENRGKNGKNPKKIKKIPKNPKK